MKAVARHVAGAVLAVVAGGCFQMKNSAPVEPERSYVFLPGRAADWSGAKWISAVNAPEPVREKNGQGPAPEGTSVFYGYEKNDKDVQSAILTASGLGVFNVFVNNTRVGDEVLKPGFTHNRKTKRSFAYDVTPIFNCASGATNEISAMVSTGWWNDRVNGSKGHKSAFIAVLEMTYADGSKKRFTTDTSWTAGVGGPVLRAGIFDGEYYDARRTAVDVTPAVENTEFKGEILPQSGASVYMRRDLAMRARQAYVWKGVTGANDKAFGRVISLRDCTNSPQIDIWPGETLVLDFGQNASAVPRFRAVAEAGTRLTILPAEMLNDSNGLKSRGNDGPEGSVYRANLRCPNGMRIEYTFHGAGVDSYMPLYTFFGYRYVSVTATAHVKFKLFESIPITSIARGMERGSIETGRDDVNRLIANVYWGQLSNYLSVPTDCPQRNERQGWMADTQVFVRAASYNADVLGFMRKFLRDVRDTQEDAGSYSSVSPEGEYGPAGYERLGWSDAGIIIPWTMWRQYGDTDILREHWNSMERFMNWLADNRYAKGEALKFQYADWLSFEDYEDCSGTAWKKGKGWREPLPEAALYWKYLGGCYWLMDSRMMLDMAKAIGDRDAEARYAKMSADALAYVRKDILEDGRIPECLRKMQTPALFALHLGILESQSEVEATRKALLENIKAHGDCLQTGFLGTSILMETLTCQAHAPDVAYTLLLQHRNPSWLYSVDQGATTIWERWNSYTKENGFGPVGMNSFNHYAYGAVLAWLYEYAAGIRPGPRGGFDEEFVLAPIPDPRLGYVRAAFRNGKGGIIRSQWNYTQEGQCMWMFTIPAGTKATVVANGHSSVYGPGTHTLEIVK